MDYLLIYLLAGGVVVGLAIAREYWERGHGVGWPDVEGVWLTAAVITVWPFFLATLLSGWLKSRWEARKKEAP